MSVGVVVVAAFAAVCAFVVLIVNVVGFFFTSCIYSDHIRPNPLPLFPLSYLARKRMYGD